MKIKKLISICKQAGNIYIYEGREDIQWLSDGRAIYPLMELPKFDENSLCAAFDIPEKQKEKITVKHLDGLPSEINYDDMDEGETISSCEKMSINISGRSVIPCHSSLGITFLDSKYLEPLSDIADEIELYERTTTKGRTYFAVKMGFMIQGIIMPIDMIDEDFVQMLNNLYLQCDMALFNKNKAQEGGVEDGEDYDEDYDEYPAGTLEKFTDG